jgi:hypothetical protein
MNQLDHLKKHLKNGLSITPLEALGLYGIFRLAARIKELRNKGWDINTDIRQDPNGKKYAAYKMAVQMEHGLPPFADAPSKSPNVRKEFSV